MKTNFRNYLLALTVFLPVFLVSCADHFWMGIDGDGDLVQATLDIDEFDGFVSTIAADIYLSQGDDFEVIMEAQQNIIDNLDPDWVSGGIWTIKYYHWVRRSKPVKIFITVPELTKVALSGSGEIIGETPFTGLGKINLLISGSGKMDLETYSEEMDITISGSGDLWLSGTTGLVDCLISGSGSINAFDLPCDEADVRISGSGNTRVDVEDYLNVHISGSGSVFYRGNPSIDTSISGSGRLVRDK